MIREKLYSQSGLPDWRWHVVQTKNGEFDGAFCFAVRTTGVFCKPSCSSKTPKRENVMFFANADEAERAGYRACLRCKPQNQNEPSPGVDLVGRAFELLEKGETSTVDELSSALGVSSGHLQKTFKSVIGIAPKEVLDMLPHREF